MYQWDLVKVQIMTPLDLGDKSRPGDLVWGDPCQLLSLRSTRPLRYGHFLCTPAPTPSWTESVSTPVTTVVCDSLMNWVELFINTSWSRHRPGHDLYLVCVWQRELLESKHPLCLRIFYLRFSTLFSGFVVHFPISTVSSLFSTRQFFWVFRSVSWKVPSPRVDVFLSQRSSNFCRSTLHKSKIWVFDFIRGSRESFTGGEGKGFVNLCCLRVCRSGVVVERRSLTRIMHLPTQMDGFPTTVGVQWW